MCAAQFFPSLHTVFGPSARIWAFPIDIVLTEFAKQHKTRRSEIILERWFNVSSLGRLWIYVRVVPTIGDTRKYSPQINVTLFPGNRFRRVNRSFSGSPDLSIQLLLFNSVTLSARPGSQKYRNHRALYEWSTLRPQNGCYFPLIRKNIEKQVTALWIPFRHTQDSIGDQS